MGKIRIGVIGTGRSVDSLKPKIAKRAVEVGKLIAQRNAILVCGGLSGVMEKAAEGAKKERGATIGILPHGSIKGANPFIDIPIATGLGEARNILVVRNSDVIIAMDGGFGTLSEIAFAKKLGKSIIGLNTWKLKKEAKDRSYLIEVSSPNEAVSKAIEEVDNWG